MNLNPTAFSDDLEEENGDKRALLLDRDHVNFCIECGSCSYVCPAHRPLAENNRAARNISKNTKPISGRREKVMDKRFGNPLFPVYITAARVRSASCLT